MQNENPSVLTRALRAADKPLISDDEFADSFKGSFGGVPLEGAQTLANLIKDLDFRLANIRSVRIRIDAMNDTLHGSTVQNATTSRFPPKPDPVTAGPVVPRLFELMSMIGQEVTDISKELTKLESFIKV